MLLRILAVILAVIIVCSIGFLGFEVGRYMINQKFGFEEAFEWAWEDYTEIVTWPFNKANAESEEVIEYNIVNRFINLMPCVNLKH